MNNERIVFLDTETTGVDPQKGNHRIIDIACIEYASGSPTGSVLQTILNGDGKPSTKGALKVHGITDISRIGKPKFKDISDNLLTFLKGAHLVIYNKSFDIGFIESEFRHMGENVSLVNHCKKITCAMELAKQVLGVNKISLDNACLRYSIDLSSRQNHGAYIDASLTAALYFKLTDSSIKPLARTPQQAKHRAPKAISIPRAFRHPKTGIMVQLNFCKNADCANFGVPARNPALNPDKTPKRGLGNEYKLTYSSHIKGHLLTCKLCNESSMLINNRAHVQESMRLASIGIPVEPTCTNSLENCSNAGLGIYSHPNAYKKNGFTRKTRNWAIPAVKKGSNNQKPKITIDMQPMYGSQRYQCKSCGKNFSVALDPQQKHYRRDVNEPLYLAFVNKGIINRQVDLLDLNPQTVYDKIDFFYQQSLLFSRFHEVSLKRRFADYTPVLSCDRQYYLSNWNDTHTPMPSRIVNTSTVDNLSGYILEATLNFDSTSDSNYIKAEFDRKREGEKPRYYRRFGQYVLSDDDIEAPTDNNFINVPLQIPRRGLLVHQTYSSLAHFEKVKSLLADCPSFVFFLDNDSGFRLGFPSVFHDLISQDRLYAYVVTTAKNGGANLLDAGMAEELKTRALALKEQYPEESEKQLWQRMWKTQFERPVTQPGKRSEWLVNPNPNSRFVAVQPLTGIDADSIEQASMILQSTSLNGVDNWFQVLRRLVNMLERPVTSATNSKRWNAYAGYNPTWMCKLIEIMRVYNNFCRTNEKSLKNKRIDDIPTTSAQRIGIADEVYSAQDILSFSFNREYLAYNE
ncbi:exonuclease domain-containing protein [Agarivorans sp. Alg241-V36]|uniref:exonuclease domain-containing protein n=1 Tax=Agarivorans sp. Alg241-V36 TaxID=2305992 RepID=UPI0013D5F454|nr:exonuclease domain-containing protein [Agarivorans sp. Alg241-V36]